MQSMHTRSPSAQRHPLLTPTAVFLPSSLCACACLSVCAGAISYFPTSVLFPILMYKLVFKPKKPMAALMYVVMVFMGLVSLMAVVGSIFSIIGSASQMKPFQGGGGHGR